MTRAITNEALAGLVADLTGAGMRVVAPAKSADGKTDYRAISSFAEAELDAEMPRRSLRAVFQPPTEPVFSWRRKGGVVELTPAEMASQPQVVLGARPCDAAGAEILDSVMNWDYTDELWFARRNATTIISLACSEMGASCFCDKVGQGPASSTGSDILLHKTQDGYIAEAVTPKGEALFASWPNRFTDAPDASISATNPSLSMDKIEEWLEGHFEDELWRDIALRCLGCGACTSICPTCHCFDIVDESDGTASGTRRRNWDTCQAGLFTVHTSGHNPRPDQNARCRQRVMHKFNIYPKRFGKVLCTGCGRCVEACPAGVNLPEILDTIARSANGDLA